MIYILKNMTNNKTTKAEMQDYKLRVLFSQELMKNKINSILPAVNKYGGGLFNNMFKKRNK